jgi:hypothetical protein
MKKLALLALVALEICVCGCGNSTPTSTINTQSGNSNWEAKLSGGQGQDTLLNFLTSFSVGSGGGTLDVTAFSFLNSGQCFPSTITASGSAVLTTNSSDQVTGTMTFTVTSASTTLSLNGNVTGTSNGSTSTTGNLTNGVVQGTWTLSTSEPGCTAVGTGTGSNQNGPPFLMCQGAATCTVP